MAVVPPGTTAIRLSDGMPTAPRAHRRQREDGHDVTTPETGPGSPDEHRHTDEDTLPEESVQMSREEFEIAVGDALDQVPAQLMDLLDNVVFFVEDEPPADDPDLLGVYDGVP